MSPFTILPWWAIGLSCGAGLLLAWGIMATMIRGKSSSLYGMVGGIGIGLLILGFTGFPDFVTILGATGLAGGLAWDLRPSATEAGECLGAMEPKP